MIDKLKLYILVGLPATGKSTWVKSMGFDGDDYVILSTDNYITKIAEQEGSTYNAAFKDTIGEASKDMYTNLRKAIKDGKNIIWDQTNLTVRKRRKVMRHFFKDKYFITAVDFQVSQKVLKERLETRSKIEGKTIPDRVIESMNVNYVSPVITEGFDAIIYNHGTGRSYLTENGE